MKGARTEILSNPSWEVFGFIDCRFIGKFPVGTDVSSKVVLRKVTWTWYNTI